MRFVRGSLFLPFLLLACSAQVGGPTSDKSLRDEVDDVSPTSEVSLTTNDARCRVLSDNLSVLTICPDGSASFTSADLDVRGTMRARLSDEGEAVVDVEWAVEELSSAQEQAFASAFEQLFSDVGMLTDAQIQDASSAQVAAWGSETFSAVTTQVSDALSSVRSAFWNAVDYVDADCLEQGFHRGVRFYAAAAAFATFAVTVAASYAAVAATTITQSFLSGGLSFTTLANAIHDRGTIVNLAAGSFLLALSFKIAAVVSGTLLGWLTVVAVVGIGAAQTWQGYQSCVEAKAAQQ